MASPPRSDSTLTGVLEKIVYSNEENHFLIGYLRSEAERHTAPITISGNLPGVQCGETLEVTGEWKQHPKFGLQFQVSSFRSTLPASVYGIRKYLGSGLIRGIGEGYAQKIVDHFGIETLNVISNHSKRLREIPGIGAQRAKSIKAAWDEQQVYREVMIFLQTHNVTHSQCIRLARKYGSETISTLRRDPYILVQEIEGIGFRTADKIAHNLGIPSNSAQRIDAALMTLLREASEDGHTCLPEADLLQASIELLGLDAPEVSRRLEDLVKGETCVRLPDGKIQLPPFSRAEQRTAACLKGLLNTPSCLPPIKREAAVDWYAEKCGFSLSEGQRESILKALSCKVSIITGGPGTGKTTLLKGLVAVLAAKKVRIHLASPTGRASKRLSEATGNPAQTIHRMLGYDPAKGGFTADESHPLPTDFVIVDEASMLDARLASSLFRAIPYSAHLLLVGDTDQLPSVGAGNVLHDLISSGLVPLTRLDYVYRQTKGSAISQLAHSILRNQVSIGGIHETCNQIRADEDLVFLRADSPETLVETLVNLVKDTLPALLPSSWMDDLQVLVPLHKGIAGTMNLNHVLQDAINPQSASLQSGGVEFRLRDRVIQSRNNYDKGVFNGDIGQVTRVDREEGKLMVDFDGVGVEYERSELHQIQLAYAISIHKSQGSEYPVIILPLLKQHFIMLDRNLVYTAITRGKRKVYILGQPEAFAMAVRNRRQSDRHTYLRERILAGS